MKNKLNEVFKVNIDSEVGYATDTDSKYTESTKFDSRCNACEDSKRITKSGWRVANSLKVERIT